MLSIIIPTLNEEKYLPLLLEEIKKQKVDKGEEDKFSSSPSLSLGESSVLEVIVADAGSEDKTVQIAKNYGCKIVKGGLPAKGRNEGAKEARGDTFLFMDADNIFLPENFLKNLLEEFEKRKLEVASFPIYPASISDLPLATREVIAKNGGGVYPQGNWFDKFAYGVYNFWVNLTQKFLAYATNSVLVRKEIHQKIGGFDEEIKIAEDHAYAKRASKFGKFGFIKTEPVLTSTRRFKQDGRAKTYLKYFLAGIYMFFLGDIKSDIFKYRVSGGNESKR